MFWVVLIAIIVLVILYIKGVFRKEADCMHCGKHLKGTEQFLFSPENGADVVLCYDCYNKVPHKILDYATSHWSYSDYKSYLDWEEATKEERSHFNPTVEYGDFTKLKIDMERCLFTIGNGYDDIVFRFMDLQSYELNYKPEAVKDGMLGAKVTGNEYVAIELLAPSLYLEEILKYGVSYRLREKGFISKKYEYDFSDKFFELIMSFNACAYVVDQIRNGEAHQENQQRTTSSDMNEVQKALALFMFDSLDDVTQDSLKKQRNIMIKAFHQDNLEKNEAYSQKINAAYELLSQHIQK